VSALAKNRNTVSRLGDSLSLPMAVALVYAGGLVCRNSAGFAVPGSEALNLVAEGRAEEQVDNSDGDAGDLVVRVTPGIFRFENSGGGDVIAKTDVNSWAWIVDDQTVAKTNGGGSRSRAGRIVDVDAQGVWVEVGRLAHPAKVYLPFAINETDTLAGTSAELVSPVAGAITGMSVIVQKAVTTGGDVTAAVGAAPVVGLACTVADAATKGTVVSDTPTAGDASTAVAAGSRIQVVPAAAFNTAGAVSGFVEITPN